MIGKSIWYFNQNRRVYTRDDGTYNTSPVWRKHWEEWRVIGETTRSWIVLPKAFNSSRLDHPSAKKIQKKGSVRGWAWSEEEIDELAWMHEHRHPIASYVQRITDPKVMRKVAEIIDYKP